jgi:hypothetical protein
MPQLLASMSDYTQQMVRLLSTIQGQANCIPTGCLRRAFPLAGLPKQWQLGKRGDAYYF